MMDLRAFFRDYITRWEGGLSLDKDDPGNWTGAQRGVGQLVGSNHGVTPAALAKHRGIAAGSVTQTAVIITAFGAGLLLLTKLLLLGNGGV